MSDLSLTLHNIHDLLAGKIDFNTFSASEGKMIEDNINSLDAALQPAARIMLDGFKAGASTLVGAGLTALGPIISASSDTQASMVLNLLQAAGVPTVGPLRPAEQAALVTIINGLKTELDHIGLRVQTQAVAKAQS